MKKWIFLLALAPLLVVYQNCQATHDAMDPSTLSSSSPQDLDMAISYPIFQRTLFPITQESGSCVQCHGVDQQPLFALPDSSLAHDFTVSFDLVDLRNPSDSKMVDKIRGGHQGFDSALADRLEAAIIEWADDLEASGGFIGGDPGSLIASYSSLYTHVFEPKCVQCHSSTGSAPDIDYTNYLNTINTGEVEPGDPDNSGVYQHTNSGAEPQGDVERLTAEELAALYQWIQRGALND